MEERLAALEWRLACAERRARQMFGLGLAVGLCVLTLLAASPSTRPPAGTKVQAPFTVVDTTGKTLLSINAANGGSALTLFDPHSPARIVSLENNPKVGLRLGLWRRFPPANAREPKGPVGELTWSISGGHFRIHDGSGRTAAELLSGPNGGELHLFSKAGKDIAILSPGARSGELHLFDTSGREVFRKP